jgi:hypothetical protein
MAIELTLPSAIVQIVAVSEMKLTASPLEAVAASVTAGSPTDLSVSAVKLMGCGCGRRGRCGGTGDQRGGKANQAEQTGVNVHQKPPLVTGSQSEPS